MKWILWESDKEMRRAANRGLNSFEWTGYEIIELLNAVEELEERIKELEEARDKAYTIGRNDGMRSAARFMFNAFEKTKKEVHELIGIFKEAGQ